MIDYKGLIEKAIKCDDMVKLLEGKDEYHCEFWFYGMCCADVTDWDTLLTRGIYPLYNDGEYKCIPEKIIEAINKMCEGDVEEIYCAFSVFFQLVMDEQKKIKPAPFKISMQLQPIVMKSVLKNKEELSKCFKWEGSRENEGMWGTIKRWVAILKEDYGVCLEYSLEDVE